MVTTAGHDDISDHSGITSVQNRCGNLEFRIRLYKKRPVKQLFACFFGAQHLLDHYLHWPDETIKSLIVRCDEQEGHSEGGVHNHQRQKSFFETTSSKYWSEKLPNITPNARSNTLHGFRFFYSLKFRAVKYTSYAANEHLFCSVLSIKFLRNVPPMKCLFRRQRNGKHEPSKRMFGA